MRDAVISLLLGLSLGAGAGAACAEGSVTDETPPWRWDAVFKTDSLRSDRPAATTTTALFDLRVSADAARLWGWSGTTLRLELLATEGGKPNRRVGTLQGISNLEVVENSVRLYSAALEHVSPGGTSALIGLYDLNSEFYSTEASGLLIHPAFGIGSEFAQTGANGPSIFPNLAFGVRLKTYRESGLYAQGVLLDAVAGDPAHPGRSAARLAPNDGVLLAAEAGWRGGVGDAVSPPGRVAIGAWAYTHAARTLDAATMNRNAGAYVLAQGLLTEGARGRTTGFVRAGIANPRVNPISAAIDAGFIVERPWGDTGPVALTAGAAVARVGSTQRRLQAARAEAPATQETTLEVGARWKIGRSISLQPLAQQVLRVAGQAGTRASVIGLRVEWTIASGR